MSSVISASISDRRDLLEMDTGGKSKTLSMFWALDPRLPRIAAQAAVEFDWLIQAKKNQPNLSHESIDALWSLLSEPAKNTQIRADNKGLNDSVSLSLLAKAYNEAHESHPVRTREELASAVDELTESLRKAQQEEEITQDTLEKMRGFCIALSEFAAAYRKMVYGNRPGHPYRK